MHIETKYYLRGSTLIYRFGIDAASRGLPSLPGALSWPPSRRSFQPVTAALLGICLPLLFPFHAIFTFYIIVA